MDKEQKEMLEKVEKDCDIELSNAEKMFCLIAFGYGKIEGYKLCSDELIKEIRKHN